MRQYINREEFRSLTKFETEFSKMLLDFDRLLAEKGDNDMRREFLKLMIKEHELDAILFDAICRRTDELLEES